jgi:hypothetical protein
VGMSMSYSSAREDLNPINNFFFSYSSRSLSIFFFVSTYSRKKKEGRKKKQGKANAI